MKTDVFTGIPLFSELNQVEREDLAKLLTPRTLEAQEVVFWIGELGDEFFIVESGQIVISVTDEGGKDVTLAVLGAGQFFGELSLLDGGRRTATARAQDPTKLFSLGRDAFHLFIKTHPTSAIHVLTTLGRRQRENLEKLRGVKNANEVVAERRTTVQHIVEKVAATFASEVFLLANLLFITAWMLIQKLRYESASALNPKAYPPISFIDQPPTFFWLGFIVTVEGLLLSIFVLNSQRRQAQRDAIKADLDYQVNRKAQLEIMHLHEKLDRLTTAISEKA